MNMKVIRTMVSTDMWMDLELLELEAPTRPVVNIRQTRRHPVQSLALSDPHRMPGAVLWVAAKCCTCVFHERLQTPCRRGCLSLFQEQVLRGLGFIPSSLSLLQPEGRETGKDIVHIP